MIRFLNRIFFAWPGVLLVVWLVCMGCVSSRPIVSSSKNDSTINKLVKKDSTVSKDSVVTKSFPQSNIDLILWNMLNEQANHKTTLDSIAQALKNLPKGAQVITIPDKKRLVELQFYKDSLGRMALRCSSLEKFYYERFHSLLKINSDLSKELTKKNIEAREQKIIDTRSAWDKLDWKVKALLWFISLGLCIGIFEYSTSQLKQVGWLSNIIAVFKRKK